MITVENERATAREVARYALRQGFDAEKYRNDSVFQNDQRWIIFWRKVDRLACSGPADESEGTLHYNMQGVIGRAPRAIPHSDGETPSTWSETGTLDHVDQAIELVKAWLVDAKEVDDLPARSVRRYGVCG